MAAIGKNGRSRHTENIVDAGTRKGNCRPEVVIPGFQLYFRFAAKVAVHAKQSVAPRKATKVIARVKSPVSATDRPRDFNNDDVLDFFLPLPRFAGVASARCLLFAAKSP